MKISNNAAISNCEPLFPSLDTTEVLIKLFALACKSDHESRALELAQRMDSQGLQVAVQYASKIRRMQLASKISEVASRKQEEQDRVS